MRKEYTKPEIDIQVYMADLPFAAACEVDEMLKEFFEGLGEPDYNKDGIENEQDFQDFVNDRFKDLGNDKFCYHTTGMS